MPNLKATGYLPGQVAEIYISHLHPEHGGGLIHLAAVQFDDLLVTIQFNSDAKLAAAARKPAYADAAKGGYPVAAMHMPFRALGMYARMARAIPGCRSATALSSD